jgi:hypothetical protein
VKAVSGRPEKDRRCLDVDFVRKGLVGAMREAFLQDGAGPAHDIKMVAQPWGFELEDVDFEGLVCIIFLYVSHGMTLGDASRLSISTFATKNESDSKPL